MLRKTLLLAAVGSFGLAIQAQAHTPWLRPSTTVISDTNQSISVDAGISTAPFDVDHAAMGVEGIKIWAPDGTPGKLENASRGRYRSTFDVKIDKAGTWRIGTESSGLSGTFKVDGEPWRLGGGRRGGGFGGGAPGVGGPGAPGAGVPGTTAPAAATAPRAAAPAAGGAPAGQGGPGGSGGGNRPTIDAAHTVATIDLVPATATDLDITESSGRNEFFVTAGEPTPATFAPTGKGLEFAPVTLPTDLVSNEPGKFRFLIDGKPAAGLKVEVIPGGRRYREADGTQDLTTDASGTVTVKWPYAGFYYLSTSASDEKPSNPRATKRRMSYAVTLEVVAP